MSGMIRYWQRWALGKLLVVGGAIAFSGKCTLAQIAPDTTLGVESSVITPTNINGINSDRISGGAIRGANLFHSFQEFNIEQGRGAYFTNPAGIENILSRVTGGNASNILGRLGVLGNANLFLINPSGIIFGRNASLDVRGSFVASTASSLNFADDTKFSATVPQTTPVLTVNVPIGLQYGGNAGSILNQSQATNSSGETVGLQVQPGKTLALVGGNVNLDGGSLFAPGGRVELGGVAGAGTVGLNVERNNLSLSFPDQVARTDVSLTNRSEVDVTAGGSGSIGINARNLNILGRSRLLAGIGQGFGSVGSQGGDITLNATDAVTIGNFSSIENVVASDATGNGGDINIKAGSLLLTRSAKLSTNITGQGDAGNISVQSNGDVSLVNSSINSNVITGNTGSISVQANGSVSFSRSVISTDSILEKGNAGSISVQANGSVSFSNNSIHTYAREGNTGSILVRAEGNILTNTLDGGKAGNIINFENNEIYTSTSSKGDAGNILVQANGNIDFLANGISSKTSQEGNTGNISVQANGNIFFKQNGISTGALVLDSRIFSRNIIPTQGNVGNISVEANGNINFENNTLTSETSNKGDAGNISLRANGNIDFTYNGIISRTSNQGDAGNILVQAAGNVSSVDDVFVSNTSSKGDAGNISVQADGNVSFASGFISSGSGFPFPIGGYSEVEGKGGDIHIQSRSLSLTDGARVFATTYGKGDAGNIQVEALDSVTLSGINPKSGFSSGLFTNTEEGATRQGGDIKVQTRNLHILDGAVLNARTRSDFDGGNITVNVKTLEVTGGGQILTTAFSSGNAGKITVNASDSITLSGSNPTYADQLAEFGEDEFYPASAASGLFSNTNPDSTGNGGTIEANAGQLTIKDGAQVSVSSEGSGNAGNLNVKAGSIFLNNQGKLQASTASGEGGNINLQVRDFILMRRQSQISAEARNNGNGGNITINSPDGFIVAVPSENSDIIANAFRGRGGNINITTSGIYGLVEYRPELPPEISDINASSQFGVNGTVEINTPDIGPNSGLINLPTVPLDTEVSQVCQPRTAENQSSFIITGRGGLPPNPRTELLTPDAVEVDWVTLKPSTQNRSNSSVSSKRTTATPEKIVEATGWVRNEKGDVVLTANPPTVTPHGSWQKPAFCSAIQSNK